MPNPSDRMPPIPAERMSEAQRQAMAEIVAGPRGALIGPFVPLLRSPDLMNRVQKVGEYLRFGSSLPTCLNELAILITARHWSQQFEFYMHRPMALNAGLRGELVDAVADRRRPSSLQDEERIIFDFCDELLRTQSVSDATYGHAVQAFAEQGVIDLTSVVGYYSLLAMVMNVARTPLPAGADPPLA
jgi:4-carboxymuconolactone decarboxylase